MKKKIQKHSINIMTRILCFLKAYLTFRRVTLASTLISSLQSKSPNNIIQSLKNQWKNNKSKYLLKNKIFPSQHLKNSQAAHSTIFKNIWLYASNIQFKSNWIKRTKLITKRLQLAFGNISSLRTSLPKKYFTIFLDSLINIK